MNSLQEWRWMMRLTLAPRSMEGIKKSPQITKYKTRPKIPPKIMKKKNIAARGRR
jgi:hypothetical protein